MNARGFERRILATLLGVGAASAVAGAVGLLTGGLGMETSVLDGSPFSDFTFPALILGGIVGGSQLGALTGLLWRTPWAIPGAGTAGCIMVGWIVGEVLLLGSDPGAMRNLQVAYVLLGSAQTLLAASLLRHVPGLARA